ncbi:LacI family transcriptional regulator (plasmid) [Rhizobium sp. CB3060]|uniref:LacI family DNA-binding transcriptional regulator n=1 Tax=Rhizobium sp. CB3060 TaxID=3138255 RepID=UPI0021A8BC7C|nr:LacI family DNA-binding transcriptional regulator [Rhizobium tropici]UWU26119.1 LacI family transcriptional regulator [Rhizobium tropici]
MEKPVRRGRATEKTAVTISDVAKAAGVSTATVSRALANPAHVRADKRAKVLEAVARLGYAPNEVARTLRAGSSRMILILVPPHYNTSFFSTILDSIHNELASNGYTMIIGSLESPTEDGRNLTSLVFTRQLDGIIVLACTIPSRLQHSVFDAGIPVVSVCAEVGGHSIPTVVLNDEECAVLQAEHLISLGHRKLMYVAGIDGDYNEVQRYSGFRKTLVANRIDPQLAPRFQGDYRMQSGAAAARTFLEMADRPTGVVCCSDEMAIGFIRGITDAGLSCPRDVSVVGFDGIEYTDYFEPTITTIRQPRSDLGSSGARLMLRALAGDKVPTDTRIVLPGELLVRRSTMSLETESV